MLRAGFGSAAKPTTLSQNSCFSAPACSPPYCAASRSPSHRSSRTPTANHAACVRMTQSRFSGLTSLAGPVARGLNTHRLQTVLSGRLSTQPPTLPRKLL